MEVYAVPIASAIIAAAGILIAGKNSERVDRALENSITNTTVAELRKRNDELLKENEQLKESRDLFKTLRENCEAEKIDLIMKLYRATQGSG